MERKGVRDGRKKRDKEEEQKGKKKGIQFLFPLEMLNNVRKIRS